MDRETGEPFPDVAVALWSDAETKLVTAITDRNGTFVFPELRPATYEVMLFYGERQWSAKLDADRDLSHVYLIEAVRGPVYLLRALHEH